MEYAKRTSLGTIKTCDMQESTYVLQTRDEYSEMIQIASSFHERLKNTERREADIRKKHANVLSDNRRLQKELDSLNGKTQKSSLLADEVKRLEERCSALLHRLDMLEAELAHEKGLNKNLLRICTERANADRDVRPKKQHDGYLVLQCQEWRERLPDKTVMNTWKSIIQSPYDASIAPEIAKKQIFVDLTSFLLKSIGCPKYVLPEDNGRCFIPEDGKNVLYCWRFSADYRSGYWTAIIYTIMPLDVPPERRARQGRKQHK